MIFKRKKSEEINPKDIEGAQVINDSSLDLLSQNTALDIYYELKELGYLPFISSESLKKYLELKITKIGYYYFYKSYCIYVLNKDLAHEEIHEHINNIVIDESHEVLFHAVCRTINSTDSRVNEMAQKVLYNLIRACLIGTPKKANLSKIIFCLRRLKFGEQDIKKLLYLHAYANAFAPYFNLLEAYVKSESQNESMSDIIWLSIKDKLHSPPFKEGTIPYYPKSSELQVATLEFLDPEILSLESIIAYSDWFLLNKIYEDEIMKVIIDYQNSVNSQDHLKSLIMEGKLREAALLLSRIENTSNEGVLLSSRINQLKQDENKGTIPSSEIEMRRNQIRLALLDAISIIK